MPQTTKSSLINKIIIKGARVHNLKNISLEIPKNKLVVMTGVSGSGKSSLAFDTIYAEGQRRYVESLSSYARQFIGLIDKPDVDQIDGLSPAIAIDQHSISHNPRSTVGTITEIYDYLRLLFARAGQPHCPRCGQRISKQNRNQILNYILNLKPNENIKILAPIIKNRPIVLQKISKEIKNAGYQEIRFNGDFQNLERFQPANLNSMPGHTSHTLEIVIGNFTPQRNVALIKAIETALELGNGFLIVYQVNSQKEQVFSQHLICSNCGLQLPEIEPRLFSFNSPYGACPDCGGLGVKQKIDPDLTIPNKKLSLAQGAVQPWLKTCFSQKFLEELEKIAPAYNFSIHTPVKDLTGQQLNIAFYGIKGQFEGIINNLDKRYRETNSSHTKSEIEKYMRVFSCPTCQRQRLRPAALKVTLDKKNIAWLVSLNIKQALIFCQNLTSKLPTTKKQIVEPILKEIIARLKFLLNVGLDYLTLDRSSQTLSGGEAQRVRLATQLGSALSGVIYVLDEPSIGLHQHDNQKLITTLKNLRDLGNTVIVVEHDEESILSADMVIDIGPGAGQHGGEIVASGAPEQIKSNPKSLTGKYLSSKLTIPRPKKLHPGNGKFLTIKGAREHNLKNIDIKLPLGKFICVTGVSGSGKSTLVNEILSKALSHYFYKSKNLPGKYKKISGLKNIDKVITIDQSPIGRTPRSNPATYTGAFTLIRELFAATPEAKMRRFDAGYFSFNVRGGRCEACQGDGVIKVEMNFLPDVYIECEECKGKRYNKEILEIHYQDKNIADILEMTVEQAMFFLKKIPTIYNKLKTLADVGLGYMRLGQRATTLSGGEAQRVKLASELSRRTTGQTLYILDEPTTGLHFEDIKNLLNILNQLVDKGNTVLVIEHNLDVIKSADWIIDLGPQGGDKGGYLVAEGTPQDIAKVKKSYTGQCLNKIFHSPK